MCVHLNPSALNCGWRIARVCCRAKIRTRELPSNGLYTINLGNRDQRLHHHVLLHCKMSNRPRRLVLDTFLTTRPRSTLELGHAQSMHPSPRRPRVVIHPPAKGPARVPPRRCILFSPDGIPSEDLCPSRLRAHVRASPHGVSHASTTRTYVLVEIRGHVHHEAVDDEETRRRGRRGVRARLRGRPCVTVPGCVRVGRRRVCALASRFLLHVVLGCVDVFLARMSEGGDEAEGVETVDDPFGWVPVQLGWTGPVIVGKCMLANGKYLVYAGANECLTCYSVIAAYEGGVYTTDCDYARNCGFPLHMSGGPTTKRSSHSRPTAGIGAHQNTLGGVFIRVRLQAVPVR